MYTGASEVYATTERPVTFLIPPLMTIVRRKFSAEAPDRIYFTEVASTAFLFEQLTIELYPTIFTVASTPNINSISVKPR